MRNMRMTGWLLTVCVVAAGCFNARVDTGLAPSGEVIDEAWAPSWIAGAVSPPVVETAALCPNGVSRVHTRRSFLNMLVGAITFGIFTPMAITVTCARGEDDAGAAAGDAVHIDADATAGERLDGFRRAAEISARTGAAVYVYSVQ